MFLVKPSYEILTPIDGVEMLRRIEAAGRTCYKSEEKITQDSAIEFVRKVIKRGHLSVIEHESLSVRFVIDRGVSHELVRHRLCAFSQESTRYCDYGGDDVTFVIPPGMDKLKPGRYQRGDPLLDLDSCVGDWANALIYAEESYRKLRRAGWPPQDARAVLPNALKTEIVTTANLREWRHIFDLRCASAAHPQIREVMIPLRDELRQLIPVVFDAEV